MGTPQAAAEQRKEPRLLTSLVTLNWLATVFIVVFGLIVYDQYRWKMAGLATADEKRQWRVDALEAEVAGLKARQEATEKLAKSAVETAMRALAATIPKGRGMPGLEYYWTVDGMGNWSQHPLKPEDRIPPQNLPVTPKEK